jgi:hypothetical protein
VSNTHRIYMRVCTYFAKAWYWCGSRCVTAKVMVVGPSAQTEWKTIESDSETPVGRAVDVATSAQTTPGRVRNELSLDSRRLGVQLECECSVSL